MEYSRTLTVEFDVGQRADLRVDNRSGTVSLRGEETRRLRAEVMARLWAEDDRDADEQAAEIARGVHQEGERVTIRAPTLAWSGPIFFGRGPRIDYHVTVPRASSAQLASRSGRLQVEDVAGALTVEARSGRVAVSRVQGDVVIVARSGSVQAEGIGGSLKVESRSGSVQVRGCRGSVVLDVRSGSIRVEEVGGDLSVHSRSGSIALSDLGGALSVRSRSGSIRYEGPLRGPFDIEAESGSILLAVDSEQPFFLDAESAHGSVRSDLPVRRSAPPSAAREDGAPRLRVRTRSGSIRITPR